MSKQCVGRFCLYLSFVLVFRYRRCYGQLYFLIVLFDKKLRIVIYYRYLVIQLYSFTLYPADSKIGRGNLVLRYFVPTFRWILEALRVEWRNSTSRFDSTPRKTNDDINYNIYLFSSSRDRIYNTFFAPRLSSYLDVIFSYCVFW